VRLVPCEAGFTEPQFAPPNALPHAPPAPAWLDFGAGFRHLREKKIHR
jgi:hypothetical protein